MKTCLVVDDTDLDRKMNVICAQRNGFNVSEAASGQEALALCHKQLPDCILLDWEMAGMDGITLLKELRRLEGSRNVVIIICTSHEHPSFVGHAYVSGASGYIAKPVSPEKLKSKIKELGLAA